MPEQLHMRCPELTNLPALELGEMEIHRHSPGQEAVWENIIEKAFGTFYSFENWLIPVGGYDPDFVLYLKKDGVDIATAMGTEHPNFPGEGWFRMVATLPEARGCGAGRLVCLAVMHDLRRRGYGSIVLSTDDHRLPAISVYKALGFEPIVFDESHRERWQQVEQKLEAYRRRKA